MGNFYGNIAVRGVERDAIVSWLESGPIPSWIGPQIGGWTVFSDPQTDQGDLYYASQLAVAAVNNPDRVAIAASVHDDDILAMFAVASGRVIFRYNSDPNYFTDATERASPLVEGEENLVSELGGGVDGTELHRLLWSPSEFVFATELHMSIAQLAGLPSYAAGFGYQYSEQGELPLAADKFTRVSG